MENIEIETILESSSVDRTDRLHFFFHKKKGMRGAGLYHERQSMLRCGVHAANNLLGEKAFCAADLDRMAAELDGESWWTRLGAGNYNVDVLEMALSSRQISLSWWDKRLPFASAVLDGCWGLVLNRLSEGWLAALVGARHWLAIRCVDGVWFNCDAVLAAPVALGSRAQLNDLVQYHLEHDGYCLVATRSAS